MRPAFKRYVLLSCLLAAAMGYFYFALFLPYAHTKLETANLNRGYHYGCDFFPLWLTSRQLVQSRKNPYMPETTNQIQVGLYGRTLNQPGDPPANYRAFAYPLYADFLALPVASIPFTTVQAIGSVLFPLIFICSCWLWLRFLNLSLAPTRLFSFLALTLVSYPVLEGIYALQPSLIVALLLAGTAAAMARNRLILAGVLLALASVKPQLIAILTLWLLAWVVSDFRHRRKFAFSFFATLVALFSASQLAVPGWLASWIRSLTEYRKYTDPPLSQFALGTIAGNLFTIGVLAIGAVIAFRSRRANPDSSQFATTFSYLLAITVLIAPSSIAVYDHILLMPAILSLLSRKDAVLRGGRPIRILALAVTAAVFWQWLAAAGVALYCLAFPEIRHSAWIMLPLRMAASVPFAVVALWLFLLWKGELSDPATLAKSPVPSG